MRLLICPLLCVFFFLSTSQAESEESDEIYAAFETCLKKNSLTEKDVSQKFNSSAQIPEEVLCYAKCFYKEIGLLDEDGKIAEDFHTKWSYEELEEDELKDLIECTKNIGVISECKDILKLEDCFPIFDEYDADTDACMKENSLTEEDFMQDFNSTVEISEQMLCFERCYFTKTGLLDENGKITDGFHTKSPYKELEEDELKKLTECTKNIGVISECKDILKLLDQCYEVFGTFDED